MGATSSMVVGKDHNIEMNIADEAPPDGHIMKRHSSQPASTLFSSLMTRQRHTDGNVRPSVSLRSSGSFDPSSPPLLVVQSEGVDKVRKEYDTLKFTKEQEIQALQRKEQKLDTENNRLRAELQALNKQCQKLRAERDTAMDSSYEATERAIALEQDREKIQRQFKIFRETKESEIQALLQAKRQLESKFQRMQAHGMATIDDHNFSGADNAHPSLSTCLPASTPLGGDDDWWAVPESEATSLFGSYAQLQNGSHVGFSDSIPDIHDITRPADSRQQEHHQDFSSMSTIKEAWLTTSANLSSVLPIADTSEIYDSTILRCYISCTPDTLSDAQSMLSHPELKDLKQVCEKEGYFLSIIHFTELGDYSESSAEEKSHIESLQHDTVQYAVSICSIFISFLGGTLGRYTDTEFLEGHFETPGSKCALFCLKQHVETSNSCSDLRQRVEESSCRRIPTYSSTSDGCSIALKEITKAVRLEFGVRVESNMPAVHTIDPSEVTCIDDMIMDPQMEQAQQELASVSNNNDSVKAVGLEKCYDRLDEVVTSPGPVPPLLVSGTSGSGKTLLLSSWTSRLRNSRPDVLILQHFITGQNSIDADPVIVLRRLLLQLRQHLPAGTQPPTQSYSTFEVRRLRETLPRWLEQLSSRRNKRIIVVIDSLDLLKDAQLHFTWLLDPLHVDVRVVISVGVDACPEEWRQFPTLYLEPLSIQSVKSLLKEHCLKRDVTISHQWERDVVSQCRTATTCHPLYVTLLSVLVCSVCQNRISENVFYACSRTRDSVELYRLFLSEIEMKCSNRDTRNQLKSILQFLVCSRNGLSETELMSLVPDLTWFTWISLLRKLTTFCIVKEQAGVITAHNSEISKILYDNYVGNEVHERRCLQKMLSWLQQCHGNQTTPRSTDLILWMLHKDDERKGLLTIIRSPLVLHIMYSRGRNSELMKFWNYLNEEKHTIAKYYTSALRQMEGESNSSRNKTASTTEVARIYESLGRFMKDLGLMEEAVSSLQRSLEIQETVLDPDHPAVADSLHHLASVYQQWGKLSTAEALYRQSLELIECAVGRDHLRVAQELGALVRIARKTGRQETADNLQQRVIAITCRNGPISSSHLERLRKRALRLEELTLGDDSLEMAQALNDLGVLYHLQNNLENAESFFQRSLKMRKKLVGLQHIDVAQSLHNIASVYNQRKQYAKAVQCMNNALEIRRTRLGKDDNSAINTLKYIAVLYNKMKNHSKASDAYKELLQITINTAGGSSTATANALVNLAVSECQNKNLDAALPLYKKALDIYRNTLGHNSQQVSQTLRNIAVLLYQQGDFEEAALVYKESMGDKAGTGPMSPQPW